jgi:hypothetical protein
MKTTLLAIGLLFALNAQAAVPISAMVSGKVTAVHEHSIEIDGKSYPIDVKSVSGDLANVKPGDKVSIEYSPVSTAAAPTVTAGHTVGSGIEVVNSATAKSGAVQVRRASVIKPN